VKRYPWRRRQVWLLPLAVLCWVGAVAFPLLAVAACYFQWGGTAVWLSAVGFLACYVGFFVSMQCGTVQFDEVMTEIADGLKDGSIIADGEGDA